MTEDSATVAELFSAEATYERLKARLGALADLGFLTMEQAQVLVADAATLYGLARDRDYWRTMYDEEVEAAESGDGR